MDIAYIEPGENGKPIEVRTTSKEVIKDYYPWWCEEMHAKGKLLCATEKNCIDDFIVVHWAIKED